MQTCRLALLTELEHTTTVLIRVDLPMRLVLISDTHSELHTLQVPDGDILIHAGDFSNFGTLEELRSFNRALQKLPHKHKISIAGNHDLIFEEDPVTARDTLTSATYIQDSEISIEGLRIYGSPWVPPSASGTFCLSDPQARRKYWNRIPEGLDLLITHCPPFGILDTSRHGITMGCEELKAIVQLRAPKIHVFGHVHGSYGMHTRGNTTFINAAIGSGRTHQRELPVVINW